MKLKKIISALSITTLMIALSGCSKPLDLSLNVKSGDKYVITEFTNQDIVLTANNQEMKTNQNIEMSLGMNIKDVDKDKNITIDYQYDSMKMSSESNGEKIEYDSTKPDTSNPLNSTYQTIIGKSFTVKINNKGELLEVTGVSELINSMVAKASGTAAEKQALKDTLSESFGDEAVKSMMKQSMNFYPQNVVKKGDTWEKKYDIKTLFPISVDNKLTLTEYKDSVISLDEKSTMTADTKNKPIDLMGVKANIKLTGDVNGTIKINKDNGLLHSGEMTQTMNGEMEMLASKTIPQNVKIPMKITSRITYSTIKK